jgi:hypothetical protein
MEMTSIEPRSESAIELAVLLRNELCALSQEDVALASLIRSFKEILKALNQTSSQLSSNSLSSTSPVGEKLEKSTKRRYSRDDSSYGLRRACRIALMESDEAATAQMIYSRILRRGSYAFESSENAFTAIEQTLCTLRKEGEVLATDSLPQLWKRGLKEITSFRSLRIESQKMSRAHGVAGASAGVES